VGTTNQSLKHSAQLLYHSNTTVTTHACFYLKRFSSVSTTDHICNDGLTLLD